MRYAAVFLVSRSRNELTETGRDQTGGAARRTNFDLSLINPR